MRLDKGRESTLVYRKGCRDPRNIDRDHCSKGVGPWHEGKENRIRKWGTTRRAIAPARPTPNLSMTGSPTGS